ncbi:MAG: response regulator [Syntrophales bacterium]|nr:response regulator [Syntrophales bacterium]
MNNDLYPVHILIVDDDKPFGQMLEKVITGSTGFACSFAEGAGEALRVMEERVVDVVITDIKMPDMSGLELTRIIKEKYDSDVIIITGYNEDFTYEEAITNGANDFIEKPVRPTELIIRLKRVLRERVVLNKYKNAETKLLDTVHQLQEATDLLVQYEKQAVIARFAAGVAHEILNPTTIISSRLQMMESNNSLSETLKESLKICRDQIQRIVKISRNLHQAAHPSPAERRLVDIGVSIQEALFVMYPPLKSANAQYFLDISPTMPMIALDPDKIERLMINLIFNALHAMEGKEEKILRITLQQVDLSKEQNWILISIADNGIGIKKEDLPKIFDPFFTTKAPGKGTGLGLSVCHGIVTEHGGKIWAENNDAGGATFFISLPYGSVVPVS